MGTVNFTINFLGIPVEESNLDRIQDPTDKSDNLGYQSIKDILGFPPELVSRDILIRYVKTSQPNLYTPIFPHTDKLFEKLLIPLKSAKRCFCLAEYLATIELSAHVGEMLALLIWQMNPDAINGLFLNPEKERALFGRTFEKLGQDQRVKVLKAIDIITDEDAGLLHDIRSKRRDYFHFWDIQNPQLEKDSLDCFVNVLTLIKNTLQINYKNGKILMNPKLIDYLKRNPQPISTEGNLAVVPYA